jgi:hypothetical protein
MGRLARGRGRAPCLGPARWLGPSGPMYLPGSVARLLGPTRSPGSVPGQVGDRRTRPGHRGPGFSGPCTRPARSPGEPGSSTTPSEQAGVPAAGWAASWRRVFLRRVRRRCGVFGVVGGFAGVGWRSAAHRGRVAAATRPHGPLDDGPDRPGPGWPGRWGRHRASGADDGPRTSPGVGHSRPPHSPVADHQGGALGGGHDPAGPAHLQRLGRRPAKGRGEPPAAVRSRAARPPSAPGPS